MDRRILILLIALHFSCSTKNNLDSIKVPDTYYIQIEWGPYNQDNVRSNFFYKSSDFSASLYYTMFEDSVFDIKSFNLNKATADSIYKLAFQNSRQFNIADTCTQPQVDGYTFAITLNQNNKSVRNAYHSLSHYSLNSEIEQIIEIIKRVTKKQDAFN